jgi:hypothetical protein
MQNLDNASSPSFVGLTLTADLNLASTSYVYLGASGTDGSWRIGRSSNDLVFQRRESSVWVTKFTTTAV